MNKSKPLPDITRLKELLDYCPETGEFHWVAKLSPNMHTTKEAGFFVGKYGRAIQIDGTAYYSHRLAWLYHHGVEPENFIDHIDGNKLNNRIANLRDVTFAENVVNVENNKFNACGHAGVTKWGLKFLATISYGGRSVKIGVFDTALKAHLTYLAYKKILHPTANRFFAGVL